MKPFEQHTPCGLEHPLVAPWAKAQEPTTASLYKSEMRPREWQVAPPELPGEMLITSRGARAHAAKVRIQAVAARNRARQLEKEIVEEKDDAAAEALSAELDAARAKIPQKRLPRAQRRALWRANRDRKRSGADAPHRELTAAWRGSWPAMRVVGVSA